MRLKWPFVTSILNSMEAALRQPDQASERMIREEVLRDTRYPLHRIADKLTPYLQVLQSQFHPEKVLVFGSYAYGNPDRDSDVDLLVVKPIRDGKVKDKVAIRSAWWPILCKTEPISFDLMLADPEESRKVEGDQKSYLGEILRKGLRVI